MEQSNFNQQNESDDELIIYIPELSRKSQANDYHIIDIYIEDLFKRISLLSSKPYKRVGFVGDIPNMKTVITNLLLDYEQVLTHRFIDQLGESATKIPEEPDLD